MERQRILERCGWQFHRIRECLFNANPEEALKQLWDVLDRRGIHPISQNESQGNPEQDGNRDHPTATKNHQQGECPEEKSSWTETVHSQRQLFLERISLGEAKPANIHEALAMKAGMLRGIIVDVLRTRPNHSCQKEALAGFVLKHLEIVTRGEPRKEFERKVKQALGYLKANEGIKEYKTMKNLRVRLLAGLKLQ